MFPELPIFDLTPGQGGPGATVIIQGTGFATTPGANAVSFNGTAATVTSVTPKSLARVVLIGATTGRVSVTGGGCYS